MSHYNDSNIMSMSTNIISIIKLCSSFHYSNSMTENNITQGLFRRQSIYPHLKFIFDNNPPDPIVEI